jgi:hypothetical protein
MLKKLFFVLLAAVPFAVSCNEESKSNCPNKVCTEEFAMITIKAVNKKGEPVRLRSITSVNQRTKESLKTIDDTYAGLQKGTYIAVDDKSTKLLSEAGDSVLVTAIDSSGTITKTAVLKVAGGNCACHVSKVSGPDEIKFE